MNIPKAVSFLICLYAGSLFAGAEPSGVLHLEGYGYSNPVRIDAKRCRGDFQEKSAVASGDTLFQIDAYGWNGTRFVTTPKASIKFKANQNWTSSNNGSKITFETSPDGSSTAAEVMSIDDNGNVAIAGTTTLSGPMSIYSRTEAQLKLSTPTAVGQLYYDSTNKAVLVTTGTTTCSDYGQVNAGGTAPAGW